MPTLRHACSCAAALFFLLSCNSNKKQIAGKEESPSSSGVMATLQEELNILDFNNIYNQLMTQRFTMTGNKVSMVTGAKGLKVTVDPSALVTEDGLPVNGKINVSLIELTNSEDLFKSNASTVSDGKLLVSGGSYYIGIESNGKKLKLKKGRTLKVEFPKLKKGEMQLFYGDRDNTNGMNWKPTSVSLQESIDFTDEFTSTPDTVYSTSIIPKYSYSLLSGRIFRDLKTKVFFYDKQITLARLLETVNKNEQVLCLDSLSFWPQNLPKNQTLDTNYLIYTYGPRFQYMIKRCDGGKRPDEIRKDTFITRKYESTLAKQVQRYYAPEQVSSLGWINCDRFYENPQKTEAQFEMPIAFNNTRVQYFLVFKKFNGLLSGAVSATDQQAIKVGNLPANEEVTMIAFTKSKGVIYHAKTDFKTSGKQKIPLDFKEISMGEMNKMFGRNMKI